MYEYKCTKFISPQKSGFVFRLTSTIEKQSRQRQLRKQDEGKLGRRHGSINKSKMTQENPGKAENSENQSQNTTRFERVR